MYLRLQQQCLRFRISKDEAQQLLSGKTIKEQCLLTPQLDLTYCLILVETASEIQYPEANKISININRGDFTRELDGRPSKTGLPMVAKDNHTIKAFIEIDIKTR